MNKYGASVSPCNTPASMENNSVLPSSVITRAVVLVYAAHIALIIACGTPYAASMSNSLALLTESNALRKSTKSKTAGMWLNWASSMIRLRAKI